MPFALVFVGLLLIVTGAKNTYKEFGAELAEDFTGPGNFTYWIVALGAMGSIGYIKAAQPFSRAFMALILVAMVLSNRGVFAQLQSALGQGPVTPQSEPVNDSQGIAIPPVVQGSSSDPKENFETFTNIVKWFL